MNPQNKKRSWRKRCLWTTSHPPQSHSRHRQLSRPQTAQIHLAFPFRKLWTQQPGSSSNINCNYCNNWSKEKEGGGFFLLFFFFSHRCCWPPDQVTSPSANLRAWDEENFSSFKELKSSLGWVQRKIFWLSLEAFHKTWNHRVTNKSVHSFIYFFYHFYFRRLLEPTGKGPCPCRGRSPCRTSWYSAPHRGRRGGPGGSKGRQSTSREESACSAQEASRAVQQPAPPHSWNGGSLPTSQTPTGERLEITKKDKESAIGRRKRKSKKINKLICGKSSFWGNQCGHLAGRISSAEKENTDKREGEKQKEEKNKTKTTMTKTKTKKESTFSHILFHIHKLTHNPKDGSMSVTSMPPWSWHWTEVFHHSECVLDNDPRAVYHGVENFLLLCRLVIFEFFQRSDKYLLADIALVRQDPLSSRKELI